MKTISLVIIGIISLLSYNSNNSVCKSVHSEATDFVVSSFVDEDPIIMRGHVKNQSGNPISGASVGLKRLNESGFAYTTFTDASGDYIFGAVTPGSYTLKIQATGYKPKSVELMLNSETERTDTLITE